MFGFSVSTELIIFSLHLLQKVDGAKILGIPIPMHSHVSESNAVAVELVRRGHHVVFYLPNDFDHSKCAPEIPVIRYGKNPMADMQLLIKEVTKLASSGKLSILSLLNGTRYAVCKQFANDTDGLEKLRQEKFDFVLADYIFFIKCYFLVPYNLSLPFAGISSAISILDIGHPVATTITPFMLLPYSPTMSFPERVLNTIAHLTSSMVLDYFIDRYDHTVLAPGLSWNEVLSLSKKAELYLENTDTLLSYPKPLMPNFIQVGGLTVKPAKPLPKNIKRFFDEAANGVIIVSFGSTFKPDINIQNIFMSVFPKLKQRVYWKAEDDKEIGNVLISKWIPQNDAVAHPNTKMIIYHCGNNGMFETLYHGVPLLCIPQAGDQFMNSRKLNYLKIGRFLEIAQLTKESLQEAITDILTNPIYTSNIKHLSKIFRSRSEIPAERAASALEHVIKFGGKHLRLNQVDLSELQLLAVDVWLAIFVLLLVFIILVIFIFSICKRLVGKKSKVKEE